MENMKPFLYMEIAVTSSIFTLGFCCHLLHVSFTFVALLRVPSFALSDIPALFLLSASCSVAPDVSVRFLLLLWFAVIHHQWDSTKWKTGSTFTFLLLLSLRHVCEPPVSLGSSSPHQSFHSLASPVKHWILSNIILLLFDPFLATSIARRHTRACKPWKNTKTTMC